jgi:hypothetical protein
MSKTYTFTDWPENREDDDVLTMVQGPDGVWRWWGGERLHRQIFDDIRAMDLASIRSAFGL